MYYYIDGYNLLFRFSESKKSLQKDRESIILHLKKEFAALHLAGLLVFDGKRRGDEESGRSYPSPLEVLYAPKGQTADQCILEKLEFEKRAVAVVTDDQGLAKQAKRFKAKWMSNSEFLQWLGKKHRHKKEKIGKDPVDSKANIERLLSIFEKKLHERSNE